MLKGNIDELTLFPEHVMQIQVKNMSQKKANSYENPIMS